MTPVKREELPELPEGWRWRDSLDHAIGNYWTATNIWIDCYVDRRGLHVDSEDGEACPFEVVAAVLFANGVTLPEVPGRSSLLGGK